MKKIILPLSIALAQMLAVSAFAQKTSTGQADASGSMAAPSAPATPAEKATARTERKTEGAAAAKSETPQEGSDKSAGTAHKRTKAQRKAAHAKRKAAVSAENKKGEINSVPGQVGDAAKK